MQTIYNCLTYVSGGSTLTLGPKRGRDDEGMSAELTNATNAPQLRQKKKADLGRSPAFDTDVALKIAAAVHRLAFKCDSLLIGAPDFQEVIPICVVGDTSTGKSTLISNMLNLQQILPSSERICTKYPTIINVCDSSAQDKTYVLQFSGTEEFGTDEPADIASRLQDIFKNTAEPVYDVAIRLSIKNEKSTGLIIRDTPGFSESRNPPDLRTMLSSDIDPLLVYVSDCDGKCDWLTSATTTLLKTHESVASMTKVVVMTKMDVLAEKYKRENADGRREIVNDIHNNIEKIKSILKPEKIFLVQSGAQYCKLVPDEKETTKFIEESRIFGDDIVIGMDKMRNFLTDVWAGSFDKDWASNVARFARHTAEKAEAMISIVSLSTSVHGIISDFSEVLNNGDLFLAMYEAANVDVQSWIGEITEKWKLPKDGRTIDNFGPNDAARVGAKMKKITDSVAELHDKATNGTSRYVKNTQQLIYAFLKDILVESGRFMWGDEILTVCEEWLSSCISEIIKKTEELIRGRKCLVTHDRIAETVDNVPAIKAPQMANILARFGKTLSEDLVLHINCDIKTRMMENLSRVLSFRDIQKQGEIKKKVAEFQAIKEDALKLTEMLRDARGSTLNLNFH